MIDTKTLKNGERSPAAEAAPECLRDIREADIAGAAPCQRLERYLSQVGNPYCFRVGKTPVRISFKPRGEPLEDKIRAYFLGLKG